MRGRTAVKCYCLLKFLFATLALFPQEYELYLDPHLGSRTGACLLGSLYSLYGVGASWAIDMVPIDETGAGGKLLGTGLRVLKGGLFDGFLGFYLAVFNHEYFGHGARARMDLQHYRDIPSVGITFRPRLSYVPPFFAFFDVSNAEFTMDLEEVPSIEKLLLLMTGGSEGSFIFSEVLREHMVSAKTVDYYSSVLFLNTRIDLATYILLSTRYDTLEEGGDISGYLYEINGRYGYLQKEDFPLSLARLKKNAALVFADPMIYYALFSHFYYDISGDTDFALPFIKAGPFAFLPYLDLSLSPYGCDRYFRTVGLYEDTFFSGYLRIGDNVLHDFWGFGLAVDNLVVSRFLRWGIEGDVWSQPEESVAGACLKMGGSAALSAKLLLKRATLKAEFGYKRRGFLPGYPFDEAPFGGLSITLF